MKIQDKLIDDKKHFAKDIDAAVEKINEYVETIDTLAKKVELAKETIEILRNGMSGNLLELASETLQKLEE